MLSTLCYCYNVFVSLFCDILYHASVIRYVRSRDPAAPLRGARSTRRGKDGRDGLDERARAGDQGARARSRGPGARRVTRALSGRSRVTNERRTN